MANEEQLRDDYTLNLQAEDNTSAPVDKAAASLDGYVKSAESAAEAVTGVGGAVKTAADQITAAGAAWDRVARRNDDVTAAVYRLKAAQEELTRIQALAARALQDNAADQDVVNRVMDQQVEKIARLKAYLLEVRTATEGAAEAEALWQARLSSGDEMLSQMAAAAQAYAASATRAAAETAVFGSSLDAMRARWDPLFARQQQYQQQLASLANDFAKGGVPLEQLGAAIDALKTKFGEGQAGIDQTRAKYDPLIAENLRYQAAVKALGSEIDQGLIPSLTEQSAYLNKLVADHARATEAITGTAAAAQSFQDKANAFAGVTPRASQDQLQQRGQDLGAVFDISNYDAARAAFDKTFAATQTLKSGMRDLQGVILNTDVEASVAVDRFNELQAAFVKATSAVAESGATADETRAKYDPLFAETQRYTEALKTLEQEISGGLLSSYEVADAALNKVIADHDKVVESITGTKAAIAAEAAEQAKAAAASAAAAAATDNLRAKYDTVYAARRLQIQQLQELQKVIETTNISATAASAALDKINTAYTKSVSGANNVAVSHGQAAFAVRQLGVQSVQFFSSIEAGQSVVTAFIQQGHQIVDVALATGTGFGVLKDAIKAGWAAITSPVGIVITTMTAAAVAIGGITIAAESSQRALATLRTQLSATRDDYVAMADEVKKAGGQVGAGTPATTVQATLAAQSIAANPAFAGGTARLAEMTKTAVYLAQVLGEDIPAATKRLSEAMVDPTKAALALATTADPLKALNAQTLDLIISLDRAGDHAAAASLTYQVMSDAAKVAESQQTALTKALEHLSTALHGSAEGGKSWALQFGEAMTAVVAGLIESVADLIDKLNGVPDAVKRARDSTTTSPTGAPGGRTSFWDWFGAALSGGQPANGVVPNAPSNAPPMGPLPWVNNPAAIQQQADINKSYIQSANQFTKAAADLQTVILNYVQRESSFQQFNPATGRPVTSTSGAQGLFQIMPSTAGGRDITSATGNINTGLDLFNQYAAKYKGKGVGAVSDAVLVDMAMVVGEGFTDQFLSGAKTLQDLSTSKRADIQHDTGFNVTAFLRTNPPTLPLNQQQQAATDAVGGVVTLANMDAQGKKISDLNDEYRKLNATLGQVQATVAAQGFATPQQQAELTKYSAAIAQNREDLAKTTNTLKAATDAYHDQAAAAGLLGAAEQKNAEIRIAANRANANAPLSAASQAQVAAEQAAAMALLSAQFDQQSQKLDQSTRQTNENADAILKGTGAVTQATAAHKALLDVQDHFLASDPQYAAALAKRTQQYLEQADAAKKAAVNNELIQDANNIELLNTEIKTLGMNSDARELAIQHLKDEQDIRLKYGDTLDSTQAKLLAERDQIAKLNQVYRDQQATLSYLAQQFSTAFDTIGNAITQAFVQGSGSAVKWGNVLQGVATQVLQAFAHLAILNPLMNSLLGQNQPTLSSALGLLGGGLGGGGGGGAGAGALKLVDAGGGLLRLVGAGASGGAASSGIPGFGGGLNLIGTQATGVGSILAGGGAFGALGSLYASGVGQGRTTGSTAGGTDLLSVGSGLLSIGKAFFPGTFGTGTGSLFGNIGQSLGLTGQGGALTGITSFLNTPIYSAAGGFFPTFASSGVSAGEASFLSSAGISAPTAGVAGASAATIGSVIGGVGAGYGVGSIIGSYEQRALNKTGPAPQIGAALGAGIGVASVALAPETFGVSLLVGGLIGGALGGAAGGLIGPRPPSAFSSTMITVGDDGLLRVGGTASQRVDASSERAGAISDAAAINQMLQGRGLRITSLEGANTGAPYLQIGQNTPGGFQDPSKYSSFAAAFPSLRFSSPDALTNQFIQGRLFASPDELQGVTTSLADFENALKGTKAESDTMGIALRALAGVTNTGVQPALQKAATFITATFPALTAGAPGSLATAQSQVHFQYQDALNTAQQLGFGYDELAAAQQKAFDKNNKAAQDALDASAASVQSRFLTAQGTVSGSPQDAMNAQLFAFDANAKQARQQLSDTLTGIFGDAYTTSADYAQRMADNDKATAEERLAIQVQFNKQQLQIQQASDQQLAALQVRFATSVAALSGDPRQIQAAQVNALGVTQAQERAQYIQSEQQTYGDLFGTADPNNLDKWIALLSSQNNEMQLLQQQIARTNLQNQIASDQQNQGFSVRSANAQAALNPAVAPQAARYAFDVQAQQEQQALYLSLTATYGNAYAQTQEYADKLLALQKVQGEERLVLEQTLHDRQMQQDIANQQQDANLRTRVQNARAQLSGAPTTMATAEIDALRAQQLTERQSFQVGLLSTFGDAYASTKEYYDKLAALNDAQVAEMQLLQAQIDRASLERNIASQQQDQSFATRYTNAAAQVSGSVSDQNAAVLAAFDAQAQAEIQNLYLSLTATYGVAYALTQDYANKLTALQKAQGEERLALQKQQDDALKSQAVGTISSLNQYAISLQTGDKSPLSPKAQLDLAQRQFETQAQLASHGNYAAVQTLQQYSEAYLAAAHTVFGSGMDYVQAFSKVISTLATVASQSPDALTASILQTETRTQTAILVEQLQELQDEVKQLRLQLVQGQTAPARVG